MSSLAEIHAREDSKNENDGEIKVFFEDEVKANFAHLKKFKPVIEKLASLLVADFRATVARPGFGLDPTVKPEIFFFGTEVDGDDTTEWRKTAPVIKHPDDYRKLCWSDAALGYQNRIGTGLGYTAATGDGTSAFSGVITTLFIEDPRASEYYSHMSRLLDGDEALWNEEIYETLCPGEFPRMRYSVVDDERSVLSFFLVSNGLV
jgi:hypothetical protein